MLPPFNDKGDRLSGIHLSSMEEIVNRLGAGSDARRRLLAKLRYLLELAERTGKLSCLLIFGSFVSNTESPRDIDIVLFNARRLYTRGRPVRMSDALLGCRR